MFQQLLRTRLRTSFSAVKPRSFCTAAKSENAKTVNKSRAAAFEAAKKTKAKTPTGPSNASLLAFGITGVIGAGYGFLFHTDAGAEFRKSESFKIVEDFVEDNVIAFANPTNEKLLPDQQAGQERPTLVLDFEGTLCHLDWHRKFGWRAVKRPGVDLFLQRLSEHYEIVLFTSGNHSFLAPWVQLLDIYQLIQFQLFRDSTIFVDGEHIKDLSLLNRDLKKVIIIDDEVARYKLQPENGVSIKPFDDINDTTDSALINLIPFLEDLVLRKVDDFREEIKQYDGKDIGEEYRKREEAQLAKLTQKKVSKGWFQ